MAATWLLWGLGAAVAAWVCLPPLLGALGLTRFTVVSFEDSTPLEPRADDPHYEWVFQQLASVGFAPVGWRETRAWFFSGHWVKRFRARFFAPPGRDSYAVVYRLFPTDPWRVAYSSVLADGSLVQTANQMTSLVIAEDGYYRRGFDVPFLDELLRLHRSRLDEFAAAGRPVARPGLDEVCRVSVAHEERWSRGRGGSREWGLFHTAAGFVATPPVLAMLYLGAGHWAVPLTLTLAGVGYAVLRPLTLRAGARQSREDDARSRFRAWRPPERPTPRPPDGADAVVLPPSRTSFSE
jgi:hypothetical protein